MQRIYLLISKCRTKGQGLMGYNTGQRGGGISSSPLPLPWCIAWLWGPGRLMFLGPTGLEQSEGSSRLPPTPRALQGERTEILVHPVFLRKWPLCLSWSFGLRSRLQVCHTSIGHGTGPSPSLQLAITPQNECTQSAAPAFAAPGPGASRAYTAASPTGL